jgi:hypothetical protein
LNVVKEVAQRILPQAALLPKTVAGNHSMASTAFLDASE